MARAATATRVSPARRVAFAVVRRTFERGAYTDRALRAEAGVVVGANIEPAGTAVRVNTLTADAAEVARRTGGRRVDELPEGLVVDRAPDLGDELMPQSRASMAVARVLAPRPGERVLD